MMKRIKEVYLKKLSEFPASMFYHAAFLYDKDDMPISTQQILPFVVRAIEDGGMDIIHSDWLN